MNWHSPHRKINGSEEIEKVYFRIKRKTEDNRKGKST